LLVRAATLRHIAMPGGRHTDVAAALSQLLSSEILPKASRGDRQLLLSNNYFREMNCYTAETSDVLRKYHLSVRLIFERYAIGEGRAGDRLDSIDLMSIEEWRTLVSHLDLVDMQFREREATQCFMRSRMRVVQESETRGRAKLLQLCYEDFLEALVRVAHLKATPTDADIDAACCMDGGEYLMMIQTASSREKLAFFERRGEAGRRPIHRCLEHLISYILRKMSTRPDAPADQLAVSAAEVKSYWSLTDMRKKEGGSATAAVALLSAP